ARSSAATAAAASQAAAQNAQSSWPATRAFCMAARRAADAAAMTVESCLAAVARCARARAQSSELVWFQVLVTHAICAGDRFRRLIRNWSTRGVFGPKRALLGCPLRRVCSGGSRPGVIRPGCGRAVAVSRVVVIPCLYPL